MRNGAMNRSRSTQEATVPTTLKDIASHLGISAAAVSMALNGKPGVSPATRQQVEAAAESLGYRTNRTGKSLRSGRTDTVGVYFPSTVMEYSLYYAEITRGIAAGLADTELSPVLLPSALETGDVRDFPAVDGFIIVEPHSDDLGMQELLRGPSPTVCIDPPPASAASPWGLVESDTAASTRDSFSHMHSRGTMRPGLLTIETVSQWTNIVEKTYLEWCVAHGVAPEIIRVSVAQSNEAIRDLLEAALTVEPGVCDGLFVCGDGFAVRIAGVLRSLGHAIGESITLVSGVDSTMMKFHTPPITSVDMDPFLYGQRAAHMLAQLLRESSKPTEPRLERIPAPLIVRAT